MVPPWSDREQEDWEARVAHGQTNPDLTDRDTDHDDRLARVDRQAEHAPARLAGPAHRYGCPLHANRVDQEIQAA